MIYYDSKSWWDTLCRWQGTVLKTCWSKLAIFAVYVGVAYGLEVALGFNFGVAFDHSALVGSSLSFLLVFHANSSYGRYWDGRKTCSEFFANLKDLAMLSTTIMEGGHGQHVWNRRRGEDGFSGERRAALEDADDRRASEARVDLVRWILAAATSFMIGKRIGGDAYYHGEIDEDLKWRLNFDRMRLRTLMSKAEFEEVDRALRVEDTEEEEALLWRHAAGQPQAFHQAGSRAQKEEETRYEVSMEPCQRQLVVVLAFLLQAARAHIAEPYGFKERYINDFIRCVKELIKLNDHVTQAMTTPLPLPYLNLVRTLLATFLLSTPFFINYTEGLFANLVMPVLGALALLGIDEIGTELENPFGDDDNDLDIQAMAMSLEKEVLRMLDLVGDVNAREQFAWLPVPKFMQGDTERPFLWYIALQREVGHLEVPRFRTPGGLRVRHLELELPTLSPSERRR